MSSKQCLGMGTQGYEEMETERHRARDIETEKQRQRDTETQAELLSLIQLRKAETQQEMKGGSAR